jgi:hypothetical protein
MIKTEEMTAAAEPASVPASRTVPPATVSVSASPGSELPIYEHAKRAVAEAHNIDEVAKGGLAPAAAMKAYAIQARDSELLRHATEIRKRAERRIGELMQAQKNTVGLAKPPGASKKHPKRDRDSENPDRLATLEEAGIDKNLASRSRKMARMGEKEFEQHVIDAAAQAASVLVKPPRNLEARPKAASRSRKSELVSSLTVAATTPPSDDLDIPDFLLRDPKALIARAIEVAGAEAVARAALGCLTPEARYRLCEQCTR